MTVRRLTQWLVLIGCGTACAAPAHAHAGYARSEPAAGAVVAALPAEVRVWFTQELFREDGANTLAVYDPDGTRVDSRDARIDDDNRTHMVVSLQAGAGNRGTYTVRWQTYSAEDFETHNESFTFTVDSSAAPATATVAPTVTPVATVTPTASLSPTETHSSGTSMSGSRLAACVGGLLGVLIVPLGVFIIQRRTRGIG